MMSYKVKATRRRPSSVRRGPGALPDEAVKTDLPVEGRLGRESLRAEPERAARTAKPPHGKRSVSPGGSSTKQKSHPNRVAFCLVRFQGLIRLRRVALTSRVTTRSHRSAPLPSPLRLAASATGGARLRGTQDPLQRSDGVRAPGKHTKSKGPPEWVALCFWCASRDSNPGPAD